MDHKQIINYRQFSWLTASLLTGGGLVSIQQVLIRITGPDAWMSYTLPTIYVLLLCYIFAQMVKRFPGKHLFEITKIVFGTAIGTVVNLILLLHLWFILVRDLSSIGKFIGITLLPNTPEEIIILLAVSLLLYYGKSSVEVLARVNDLMFPFFLVMILALPLLLVNEADNFRLMPLMTESLKSFLFGSGLSIGWYGDFFVMGAFLHTIWNSKQVRASLRHGVFLSSFLLGIFIVLEVLVLGPNMPGNFLYPNYNLVQQIHITDFLDRMDLVILSIWFPVTACEVILIYLAFITGIASLVKQRDYSSINTPVVLLLLLTTLLSFKSTTEVFSFGNYSSPVIVLSYQPLLFLLIWLFSLRFPVRETAKPRSDRMEQEEHQQRDGTRPGQADPGGDRDDPQQDELYEKPKEAEKNRTANGKRNPAPRMFHRFTVHTWEYFSNALVIIGMACVGAGLWLGRHYSNVGIACGITYGFCAVVVVLSSYMEVFMTKQQRKG